MTTMMAMGSIVGIVRNKKISALCLPALGFIPDASLKQSWSVILRTLFPRRPLLCLARSIASMPPPCPPPAAYRASVLHFTRPPPTGIPRDFLSSPPPHEYFEDGCLLVANGKVVAAGA